MIASNDGIVLLYVNMIAVHTVSIQKYNSFYKSVRTKFKTPLNESASFNIENEFNCKIINNWTKQAIKIYFESEKQMTWFLMNL